jgi:hypothetical protein
MGQPPAARPDRHIDARVGLANVVSTVATPAWIRQTTPALV